MHNLSEDTIRQRLATRAADPYISPYRELHGETEPRPAAVLIPLLRQNDEWHLLYILRAQVQGDMHSGQVAFPGGRLDPHETQPEQAALREAQEEIGLEPSGVRLLGHMEEFITISNYRVTPVVGVIPWPFELHLQGSEVQRAFTIPLAWLADPANREERQRIAPDGHTLNVVYFTEYDRELLWGLTARITLNFLDALGS
ncbi:MAG: CoA pyrophosphatase [Anaerolineales bacterium]|nr:CoA pyrophosphatase [Anaerolineales bacterium]MCW5854946.1 CoA pyrophosphatase [Anaerolineales bacterium]